MENSGSPLRDSGRSFGFLTYRDKLGFDSRWGHDRRVAGAAPGPENHRRERLLLAAVGAWLIVAILVAGCVSTAEKQRCARFCEDLSAANVYPLPLSAVESSEVLSYPLSGQPELCVCSLAFRSGAVGGHQ